MNKTGKNNKKEVALTILQVIGVAGILSVALVAPNSMKALKLFGLGGRRRDDRRYYIKSTINKLKNRGLIVLVSKNNKQYFKLTNKGKTELIKKQKIKVNKPKRWNRKWQVVIFDIKEEKRAHRNQLRNCLKNIGFKKVQNSVWAYPYKCDELIFLLKTDYSLGKDVLYMEVDHLENDRWLKKSFKLIS